jgi:hypothetical protein
MKKNIILFFIFSAIFYPLDLGAQNINVDANNLLPVVSLFFSPSSGSFLENSTFEVPIIIDTKGHIINGVDIRINFDKDKLSVAGPSAKTSIVGVWVEPPFYDNTKGLIKYVGVIPEGISTSSGVIGSIIFKSKDIGKAKVAFDPNSKVLLNDGLGTEAKIDFGRGEYTVAPKIPEGVKVYSETHPLQSNWYPNNTPVLSWDKDDSVSGYSYILDNKPNTIPDNTLDTSETIISFENLKDGLWYFHIKANKNNLWGQAGHFLIRIDSTPPAEFRPELNYLVANTAMVDKALISFYTTENLSGISHYVVGVISKSDPITVSPVFIQTESPFQIPLVEEKHSHAIVRALDKAGNIREASVDIESPAFFANFIKKYSLPIALSLVFLAIILFILEYFLHHHIIRHLKRAMAFFREDQKNDMLRE